MKIFLMRNLLLLALVLGGLAPLSFAMDREHGDEPAEQSGSSDGGAARREAQRAQRKRSAEADAQREDDEQKRRRLDGEASGSDAEQGPAVVEPPQCSICFGTEAEYPEMQMLSKICDEEHPVPHYVHRACLLQLARNRGGNFPQLECPMCRTTFGDLFLLKHNLNPRDEDRSWLECVKGLVFQNHEIFRDNFNDFVYALGLNCCKMRWLAGIDTEAILILDLIVCGDPQRPHDQALLSPPLVRHLIKSALGFLHLCKNTQFGFSRRSRYHQAAGRIFSTLMDLIQRSDDPQMRSALDGRIGSADGVIAPNIPQCLSDSAAMPQILECTAPQDHPSLLAWRDRADAAVRNFVVVVRDAHAAGRPGADVIREHRDVIVQCLNSTDRELARFGREILEAAWLQEHSRVDPKLMISVMWRCVPELYWVNRPEADSRPEEAEWLRAVLRRLLTPGDPLHRALLAEQTGPAFLRRLCPELALLPDNAAAAPAGGNA